MATHSGWRDRLEEARGLHERAVVMDLHSHYLLTGHYLKSSFAKEHGRPLVWNPLRTVVDLPRVRRAGINILTATIYVLPGLRGMAGTLANLDTLDRIIEASQGGLVKVTSAREMEQAVSQGQIGLLPAVEGARLFDHDPANLAPLYDRGVRLVTLAHMVSWKSVDSSLDPRRPNQGLSPTGRGALKEMQRLGMAIDLAHMTEQAFWQALDLIDGPVLVSHTGARSLNDMERNISDDQIRAIAGRGGLIGVILYPWYLTGMSLLPRLEAVARTYAHIANLVGSSCLALGTDMNSPIVPPVELRDIGDLPHLSAALLDRGFTPKEVEGILGANALRFFSTALDGV